MTTASLPRGDETVITRNEALLTTLVNQETLMMDIQSGRYFGLDDIGSAVWQRLEKPCRFGDLVDGLAAEYDADRARIAEDVSQFLTTMAEHKVVALA